VEGGFADQESAEIGGGWRQSMCAREFPMQYSNLVAYLIAQVMALVADVSDLEDFFSC
jgi:hypothetical protein